MRAVSRRIAGLLTAVVVLAGIGYGLAVVLGGSSMRTVSAIFPRTIGIYVGNDVRILGVPVGHITKITPQGTDVRVDMVYKASDKVPANAGAVIVPPSIVSDRYIQLTPAYTGGAVLPDHAMIPQSRTLVPLELDQIFSNLNSLNVALGPNGANVHGALSDLLKVSAANLSGNGRRLHDTLGAFAQALTTISNNRGNLFGTLTHLQAFTDTLAKDNTGVISVNNDLSQVASQLAGERADLGSALHELGVALGAVQSFVADNKVELTSDVSGLTSITGTLVKEKTALMELLDDSSSALENLALAYDPKYQVLDTRGNEGNVVPTVICQLLDNLNVINGSKTCPLLSNSGPSAPGAPVVTGSNAFQSLMGVTK